MPALQIELRRQPVVIAAAEASWLAHYAEYFQAYAPAACEPTTIANALTLELRGASSVVRPAADALEKLAETGVVSLWRAVSEPATLWLYAGATTFEITPATGRAIGYLDAAALAAPPILTNTYSLFALLLLLRWRGIYHLHAAAVRSPEDKFCWIVGAPRSGKTTLATALGLAGWQPLGDDSLLLEWQDAQALWQPLRKAFHLGNQALAHWQARLTGLSALPRYLDRHSVAALEFFQTEQLAAQTHSKVDALFFPQVESAPLTRLEPLAPSEALRRLAEQSAFFQLWREHTAQQWSALSQFAAKAPSFTVLAGADVLDEPERVAETLRAALR